MNWQHWKAFVWLRWRLLLNQWRRAGRLNAILMVLVVAVVSTVAIPLGGFCFYVGTQWFPQATPTQLLMLWDGLVVSFIFFWCIGLVAELQRTEVLSLAKFMHLPVDPRGAFLINYLSSLVTLTLILFLPALLGFTLALAIAKGPPLLVAFPLTAAFLLMVTGITYQFQGWLASLMSNPRRRRNIVMLMTVGIVVLAQLPNLMTRFLPHRALIQNRQEQLQQMTDAMAELDRDLQSQKINLREYQERQREVTQTYVKESEKADTERTERLAGNLLLANRVVPVGWLPLGVMATVEGNFLPAILGGLGMTLLGGASLWRAYRTTLRMYQGQFTSEQKQVKATPARSPVASSTRPTLLGLETHLPGLSEPAAVISLAGFRSILRAPEGKMMLITPVVIGVLYGLSISRWPDTMPTSVRPLIGCGAIMITLFGMMQIMANQFGFDRDGFRVFVLCAAKRRDILLGKNLAFAPLALGITTLMIVALQFFLPMKFSHLLAMVPQWASMFLIFCLLMNMISIYAPMAIAAGSLKPAKPRMLPILLQTLVVFVFLPLSQLPTLLPLGIETLLEWQGHTARVPVYLLLGILQFGLIALLYRYALGWQGRLLEEREQQILETVTGRAN